MDWTSLHDETLYPGLDVRLVTQSAGQDGSADKRGAELETAPPTVTPRGWFVCQNIWGEKVKLCRFIDWSLPAFFLSQPFILQLRAGPGQSFTSLWKMHPELRALTIIWGQHTNICDQPPMSPWSLSHPLSPHHWPHTNSHRMIMFWDCGLGSGLSTLTRWLWPLLASGGQLRGRPGQPDNRQPTMATFEEKFIGRCF